MSALTDFLLARIAEDDAAARAVSAPMHFAYKLPNPERDAWTEHIHRHEPARVLADLDGKRRLVEGVRKFQDGPWSRLRAMRPEWLGPEDKTWAGDIPYVLRCLSTPYAHHPDYRDEWKP